MKNLILIFTFVLGITTLYAQHSCWASSCSSSCRISLDTKSEKSQDLANLYDRVDIVSLSSQWLVK